MYGRPYGPGVHIVRTPFSAEYGDRDVISHSFERGAGSSVFDTRSEAHRAGQAWAPRLLWSNGSSLWLPGFRHGFYNSCGPWLSPGGSWRHMSDCHGAEGRQATGAPVMWMSFDFEGVCHGRSPELGNAHGGSDLLPEP